MKANEILTKLGEAVKQGPLVLLTRRVANTETKDSLQFEVLTLAEDMENLAMCSRGFGDTLAEAVGAHLDRAEQRRRAIDADDWQRVTAVAKLREILLDADGLPADVVSKIERLAHEILLDIRRAGDGGRTTSN